MSEEELNQELSTDELKDVSGGFTTQAQVTDVSNSKGNNPADKAKLANRITTDTSTDSGKKK